MQKLRARNWARKNAINKKREIKEGKTSSRK